eukprot:Gb_03452 [translate_table: standard]
MRKRAPSQHRVIHTCIHVCMYGCMNALYWGIYAYRSMFGAPDRSLRVLGTDPDHRSGANPHIFGKFSSDFQVFRQNLEVLKAVVCAVICMTLLRREGVRELCFLSADSTQFSAETMLATTMVATPTQQRSSLEEMLEAIKKREDRPKDVPPALPQRPTSKARLPSIVKTRKTGSPLFNRSNAVAPNHSQPGTPSIGSESLQSSAHIQGIWINTEDESAAKVGQVDKANGNSRELAAMSRTEVKSKEYNQSLRVARNDLHIEGKRPEKPEVIVPESDPELIEDGLKRKSGVTRSKDRSPVESPYKKKVETKSFEDRSTESDDSDVGSSTPSTEQGDRKWRDDSVSGMKKV